MCDFREEFEVCEEAEEGFWVADEDVCSWEPSSEEGGTLSLLGDESSYDIMCRIELNENIS